MDMHRFWRQPQLGGNLFYRHTLGEFFRHLTLAFGQRILPTRRQFHGNIGGQIAAARRHRMHRGDQFIRTTAFREKTARAGVQRLFHQRRAIVNREHDRRHPFWQLA
ncbi:Uncharacterised protein [Salmonella enterica subsp. enterica serovar Typhimurium str. DT104]|nr:Uncharacterised protein [Salmonella enterica subsp. enterica serovar Typhimurium str. DT104]